MALALLPALGGCVALVGLPLITAGGIYGTHIRRVRAATRVPKPAPPAKLPESSALRAENAAQPAASPTATPAAAPAAVGDPAWQSFFDYATKYRLPQPDKTTGKVTDLDSALLAQPPAFDVPVRSICHKQPPAVIIDLDDGSQPFVPAQLPRASAQLAMGLAQLRDLGVVVLWISQLPASRASDVAQAIRSQGYDPKGLDQLLLIRSARDRKQLLRENASDDVCVIAIAGDVRGDFDELFDYLRVPGSADGLNAMLDHGWFLVPPLDAPVAGSR